MLSRVFTSGRRVFFAATLCSVWVVAVPLTHAATVIDAAGRTVAVGDTSRIISIGGAVTEILYALAVDKAIVGVDTTSLYPPSAATEKASVGYMRQLSAEGVLGLSPSLILVIAGAGPKETMAVLEAARVPMVIVPDSYTGNGIAEKVRLIAQATNTVERGRCIVERVRADLDALGELRARVGQPKRVLFVLSFVDGPAMAAGLDTAADGVIRLAGGVNAIDAYHGYKPLNDEAVVAAKPDVVLAMKRAGPNPVSADMVFAQPAFAASPAAAKRSFIAMDGLYLLGFGPRTASAARDLAMALYPELKGQVLPSEHARAGPEGCGEQSR